MLRDDEFRRTLRNPSWRSIHLRVFVIYFLVGMNGIERCVRRRSVLTTDETTEEGARKRWDADVDNINNA